MFRVKIQVPKEIAEQYIERIKTGVRGVGYVKVKDSAVWPARLQNLVPRRPQARQSNSRRGASIPWYRPRLTASSAGSADGPVVSIRDVTHRYGKVVALDGISLDIPARRSWSASSAPTASASRRCWRWSPDRRRCSKGQVTVLDGDIGDARHRRAVGPRIAYMPQGLGKNLYLELSVYDNVDFMAQLFGLSAARAPQLASRSCSRPRASARSPIARPASSRAE